MYLNRGVGNYMVLARVWDLGFRVSFGSSRVPASAKDVGAQSFQPGYLPVLFIGVSSSLYVINVIPYFGLRRGSMFTFIYAKHVVCCCGPRL